MHTNLIGKRVVLKSDNSVKGVVAHALNNDVFVDWDDDTYGYISVDKIIVVD